MKTIWKSILEITGRQIVELPREPWHLAVQMQGEHLCLWSMVDTDLRIEHHPVIIVGTGNPIPEEAKGCPYIGSVQERSFVWHVFAAQS
jgi:hypothetical protein